MKLPTRPTKDSAEKGFEAVQQEWVLELPLKMQTVLLANIRGVDSQWMPGLKTIGRWYRSVILNNGNKTTDPSDFMKPGALPTFDEPELLREVEYVPVHFFHHLILGMEIIAYKHPDGPTRRIAEYYYLGMVGLLHMNPETEPQLNWRLEDDPGEARDKPPPVPDALRVLSNPPITRTHISSY